LLTNEDYQKDKHLATLLNTRIKEMLGESIAVMERKLSGAESKKKEEIVKAIKRDNPDKREGKGKSSAYAIATAQAKKVAEGSKPDFLDMDDDGNKKEPMKKAIKDKKVSEKFDPLKHVKNPTPGEKKAAKDVKRSSYADRAAMLKSAEADGRLKDGKVKESENTEGNAFGAAVRKAKADGVQKGEKVKVGGKEYAVKEGDKQTMSRAAKGHEKYGKEGMAALAKAGREGKDLDKIRDKYNKYDEAVEEGFPTVADAKARAEKEKTTGKFDKKETGTGTVYTRKSSTFSDGGDDTDVKKAKKAAKVKEGSKNLPGNQEKIDADGDGKIEKSDFAKLRAGKKKMKESQHKQNVKIVNENVLRLLAEDEEGKAKTITAGADMVNDFTSWMTRIGQYQTKSMIELADTIRANFGQNESEQFKSAVAPALETALNTLTQAREEISNAVAVLAGEAPAADPMGSDMGGNMDMTGNEEIPDAGMDSMNMGDEFGASDAAAGGSEISGRTQRESRELFARKLSEAHSIIGRLSK